jgi:hypothetical protein
MNPNYSLVATRAAHRCEYCHAPEAIFNFPFEVEHIVPQSQQGADDEGNLALSCRSCNLHKRDFRSGTDELSGTEERLYHPRHDVWGDHFEVEADTGAIRGLTPSGRATVMRLRMNHPLQLEARLIWMQLGLFP